MLAAPDQCLERLQGMPPRFEMGIRPLSQIRRQDSNAGIARLDCVRKPCFIKPGMLDQSIGNCHQPFRPLGIFGEVAQNMHQIAENAKVGGVMHWLLW